MIIYDTPTDRQVRDGAQRGRVLLTSHLMSTEPGPEGTRELLAWMEAAGFPARWVQHRGTPREHLDLIGTRRIKAAREAGATLWKLRQVGELVVWKRQQRGSIRLLVTGGRELAPLCRDMVEAALLHRAAHFGRVTVVHGAARGADRLADWVAMEHGWTVERYPARDFSWPTARNQHMVDLGASHCLAFPTLASRGTWDCVRRAKKAGIPVSVHQAGGAL
jgi:hypothetical protein